MADLRNHLAVSVGVCVCVFSITPPNNFQILKPIFAKLSMSIMPPVAISMEY
jgi:hypothetical protein